MLNTQIDWDKPQLLVTNFDCVNKHIVQTDGAHSEDSFSGTTVGGILIGHFSKDWKKIRFKLHDSNNKCTP